MFSGVDATLTARVAVCPDMAVLLDRARPIRRYVMIVGTSRIR
jgi:hypothetical protein